MKQQLWVLNSSLVLILVVVVSISLATFVRTPKIGRLQTVPLPEVPQITGSSRTQQKIYLNDLFDTYTAEVEAEHIPIHELPGVPPMPASVLPSIPPQVPTEKLPVLPVQLRGIILSSQRLQSAALIEDETGKEVRVQVGEKVKDAQIIKIASDRIIMLRANGQQDMLFLRKSDQERSVNRWANVIKKISDTEYQVDINRMKREIATLGGLLEELSLTTIFENTVPIGLHVGIQEEQSVGLALGLHENDILMAINGIGLAQPEDRIAAFDLLCSARYGSSITVELRRQEAPISIVYTMTYISTTKPATPSPENLFEVPASEIKKSQYKKRQQEFNETADQMRSRLIENVRLGRPKVRTVM